MALSKNKTTNEYRYERKFHISGLSTHEVESIVYRHPSLFSEIYKQRYVNNIYFDSLGSWHSYLDNLDGSQRKIKVRIRWYGDLFGFIEQPELELKIKNGLLGRKERYSLPSFHFDRESSTQVLSLFFGNVSIPGYVKELLKRCSPTLLNRYKRKYFQSASRDYRITIDSDLEFYQISSFQNSFLNNYVDDISVVLELKYSKRLDTGSDYITNFFPFRMTKFSKYVIGIDKILR